MEIKLNGKALLGIALISSSLVFAEFVTTVDLKSSGGINVVGVAEEDVMKVINSTMPVGSVVFRMDSLNPTDIYGGTWELITGDANLTFGDGTDLTGSVDGGINTPIVPVPYHRHSINHDHPSVNTSSNGNHKHNNYQRRDSGTSGDGASLMYSSNADEGYAQQGYTNTTGAHTHSVNLPNFSGNSGYSGTSNVTIDVRGSRIAINVWKRTS